MREESKSGKQLGTDNNIECGISLKSFTYYERRVFIRSTTNCFPRYESKKIFNKSKTSFNIALSKDCTNIRREPWYSGYGRRLIL